MFKIQSQELLWSLHAN